MSFNFRNLYIAAVGLMSLSVLAVSCGKDVPEQEDGGGLAGNVTVKFAADYTSVMRNPLNGWVTYLGRDEAWCNSFPGNYTGFIIPGTGEKVNVFDYSSTAYLRTNWKAMEPTEGDYFWLHEDHYYTRMLQACWDMGVKVAFRITFDGRDQQQNTPDYVFEAGADWYDQPGYEGHGRISPYPDDPVFQEKYTKFIEAFAKEFDDPDKVDFIDGFSPGKWGEAHALIYKDPAHKAEFFDWMTDLYSRCFIKVPIIINYHRLIADTNQDSWQETVPADTEPLLESAIAKGYSLRHDAFGMTGYYKDWEKAFAAKWNFKRPILMEGGWVLGTHRYWIDPSGDYIEGEPWTVREGEYKASQEARVNTMDFRVGGEINSWFGDTPDLIQRFIEEGGYRLYPPIVSAPETLSNGKEVTVSVGNAVAGRMNAFENFVRVQSDAALRQVAGQYAYDDNEGEAGELTLRSGGEEINEQLEQKLNERLVMAGLEVMEARINYLAYAPEIAAVMLRRQQASAIIGAREKIVEGAVSMVHMALDKLKKDDVVDLDEDKKAAMVSNLLVVLCADESAQPVLNTGTLNH